MYGVSKLTIENMYSVSNLTIEYSVSTLTIENMYGVSKYVFNSA